ncbi:hypothetical protein NDU88_009896 [Pleurodeles waltl]|uniref:Uncharacterized protein n=1 Tax=Pleurodeles waltl TaxID=8319 RepID=A0AAV7RZR2_PLEWA|nr:hypothetical protein NDU88_009896 [Pleurodeles waltl]
MAATCFEGSRAVPRASQGRTPDEASPATPPAVPTRQGPTPRARGIHQRRHTLGQAAKKKDSTQAWGGDEVDSRSRPATQEG